MTTADDIKQAMRGWRAARSAPSPRGRALFELNRWKGEEAAKLNAEYQRRLAEIEAMVDPERPSAEIPEEIMLMAAKARREGVSRSDLRKAFGKASMEEIDAVLDEAEANFEGALAAGDIPTWEITDTGVDHGRGFRLYDVTNNATGQVVRGLYVVPNPITGLIRTSFKMHPAPAGSKEVLDGLWMEGVATAIYEETQK